MPVNNRKKYKSKSNEMLKRAGVTSDIRSKRESSARNDSYRSSKPETSPVRPVGVKRKRGGTPRRWLRRMRRARLAPVILCSMLLIAGLFGIIFLLTNKNTMEVFVEAKSVGKVKNKKLTLEDLNTMLLAKVEESAGTTVRIREVITIEPAHGSRKEILGEDALLTAIMQKISYDVSAGVIMLDGAPYVTLQDTNAAQAVLDELLDVYRPEDGSAEMSFVENVTVVQDYVARDDIITAESALQRLGRTTKTSKVYTVVSGDTASLIAQKNGMTNEELYEANPGLTPQTILQVGDSLNVMAETPFLSVKAVQTVTNSVPVERAVQETDDPTLSRGVSQVTQEGKDGSKEIIKQIISINGVVEEEKTLSENIVEEPVPRIIARGTG